MALAETARLIASLELQDKFSKNVAAYENAVGSMAAKTATLDKLGNDIGRGLRNTSQNLARLGAVGVTALVGIVGKSVNAAIDFEDAFAGIKKTVDETDLRAAGLSFDSLSDSIRKMAREIPISAVELAKIGEAAGALGIRATDIEAFTKVVAELSVTTNLTSEDASTALGQLGTVLHLTGGDFQDFADSLVALGNAGASTESQIVDIAARFAAAGNAAGLSKEEILALSSASASMGIEAEAAGSALSKVFNSVATNIGTSNSKAAAFAEALSLSAEDFKKAWAKDALGTFDQFLAKLNTLDQFEAASLLKKVGITSVRDVSIVRLMAQNVKFVNDQLEISRHATGALGEEAAKKFATTASQLNLLKNNLTDVGITIGDAVLPKITELSRKFVDFLNQPGIQSKITDFANAIPGAIDQAIKFAGSLPWATIGSAFELMGKGAQAALGAFESAPAWLQTAVLTGWGLNKLTGGALGSIVGDIGKLAFGGSLFGRGSSPANPVWVQSVGGIGGPGGPGDVLGKGLTLAGILKFIGFRAIPALVVGELAGQSNISGRTEIELLRQTLIRNGGDVKAALEQTGTTLGAVNELLAHPELQTGLSPQVLTALDAIDGKLGDLVSATTPTGGATGVSGLGSASHHRGTLGSALHAASTAVDPAIDRLLRERQLADTALAPLGAIEKGVKALPPILDRSQRSAQALAASSEAFRREAGGSLSTIAAKDTKVTVNVSATTNVSVSNLERTLISHRIAGSTTVGGFTESAF